MATAVASAAPTTGYLGIPLEGLAQRTVLQFPLYLRTAVDTWILYRDINAPLGEDHLGRLQAEGTTELWVRDQDRLAYFQRVEGALDQILRDKQVPVERRVDVLHGVAVGVAETLLASRPTGDGIKRAQKVLVAASGLMLREGNGFQAIRRVLSASRGLAAHSLMVSFMAMGLVRQVLGADPSVVLEAGLAGLLHDVGKVGHEELDHDPEHTSRGHDQLRALGLAPAVCEAALYHHERWDGSGFPRGLAGTQIPALARVVGLVNTFDKVFSGQTPRVSVFDALRILAQAYRGCFEEALAQGFVKLFRG